MKMKPLSSILIFIFLVIIIIIPGCGGSGTWNGIPIYPGATLDSEEDFERVYSSSDNYLDIKHFYQREMVNKGWHEQHIGEGSDPETGYPAWEGEYSKKNPNCKATVIIRNFKDGINFFLFYIQN